MEVKQEEDTVCGSGDSDQCLVPCHVSRNPEKVPC